MNKLKFISKTSNTALYIPEEIVDIVDRAYKAHKQELAVEQTFASIILDIMLAIKEKWGYILPEKYIKCFLKEEGVCIQIDEEWIQQYFNVQDPFKYVGIQGVP